MKRSLILLTGALLILSLALPAFALPAKGTKAPEIKLMALNGKEEITLSSLRGKVVYIDFWASWCPPCRKALPEIIALHEEFGGQGFEVLAVSLDRTVKAAREHMEKIGAKFLLVYDAKQEAARTYQASSIPSGILVDVDGNVAWTAKGFDPRGMPALKSLIKELLEDVQVEEIKASN
ncbi:MAG: TlpA family protein disulfide reductase [bacterium]|nr:TlpA family protein disulfide reductase [bacterium]